MRRPLAILWALTAGTTAVLGADDFLDRIDEALNWTAWHDSVRARVSGTIDLEDYTFTHPSPGLIHTEADSLFNPRLTLFLDAQLGPQVYVFAQSRGDHGFDPRTGPGQWRIDEYALRYTPRADGVFNLQVGKFSTVVGNWVSRHQSWGNPFITAPLPYENLTGIFDTAAASSAGALLLWSHVRPAAVGPEGYFNRERVPVVWGPSYASGMSVTGLIGRTDYAFEVKNTALSSRPTSWDAARTQWQHPTFSGRLGFRPDESWSLGFSASTGCYLNPVAQPTLAPGSTLGDYREVVCGQDIGFAWHHLQLWAEAYEAAFEIPRVGQARTLAYYLEAKYKFTPQLSGAVRWNQQIYGDIPDGAGGRVRWDRNTWRVDFAPAYRFTTHTECKLQYSLQYGGAEPGQYARLLAAQFIVRF